MQQYSCLNISLTELPRVILNDFFIEQFFAFIFFSGKAVKSLIKKKGNLGYYWVAQAFQNMSLIFF